MSLIENQFELIRRNLRKFLNLRWQNQYLKCTYEILDPYNKLYRNRRILFIFTRHRQIAARE